MLFTESDIERKRYIDYLNVSRSFRVESGNFSPVESRFLEVNSTRRPSRTSRNFGVVYTIVVVWAVCQNLSTAFLPLLQASLLCVL